MADEPEQDTLKKVGKYELVRKIATGGMAELFLAKFNGPGGFEKRCALKRILPQFVGDDDFKRMFMNEARVAAMFDHPNLVQIFELGQDENTGQFYIAMELINGMDLRQLQNLARERGADIPPELAAWLMAQSLDGLHYAHHFKDIEGHPLNLVHRDVSPQNVLVSYEGAIKVVDFGIVKSTKNDGQTQTGMLKGKIAYMSPEQATAEKLDLRSDLFAVGICLYELVCGVKPFRGPNEIMTLKAILEQEPADVTTLVPDCPEGIERAIMKALSKSKDDRYQTAREFQLDLMNVLRQAPIPIDRHVFAEFMRTLTEGGTDRFDATKLKIPREASSPSMQARFAVSEPAAAVPTGATAPGTPKAMLTASGGSAPAAAPLADPVSSVSGVTHPGLHEAPIEDEARAAGAGSKGAFFIVGAALFALAIGIAWFATRPGDGMTVQQMEHTPPAAPTHKAEAPTPKTTTAKAPIAATPPPKKAETKPPTSKPAPPPTSKPAKPVASIASKKPTRHPTRSPSRTNRKPAVVPPPPPPPPPRAAVPSVTGQVSLTSVPRGLTVKLGGKKLGTTPLNGYSLPVGTHTLKLSNPRLGIAKTLRVRVTSGGNITEKVTVGRGTVVVNSRPWSNVFIDGRSVGKTPLKRPVYEGRHKIKLVTEGGSEQVRTIGVTAGQDAKVLVKF